MRRQSFFIRWLYAFIPAHVSNGIVLGVMQIMRFLQRRGYKYAADHLMENKRRLNEIQNEAAPDSEKYIEDQKSYKNIRLGKSDIAVAGCEVIATYNVLRALKMTQVSFAELISDFEKDGIIYGGRFGVAASAMRDRLKAAGLDTVMTTDKGKMGGLLKDSEVSILTMYNDRTTIGAQVHSVTVTGTDDEHGYYVHNVHGDGKVYGPFSDWSDLIKRLNDGRIGPISLIGVRRHNDVRD